MEEEDATKKRLVDEGIDLSHFESIVQTDPVCVLTRVACDTN